MLVCGFAKRIALLTVRIMSNTKEWDLDDIIRWARTGNYEFHKPKPTTVRQKVMAMGNSINNMTYRQIADKVGCSHQCVQQLLKRMGIKKEPKKPGKARIYA